MSGVYRIYYLTKEFRESLNFESAKRYIKNAFISSAQKNTEREKEREQRERVCVRVRERKKTAGC